MKEQTKLKFTLAEDRNPLIERYSNDLKTGERQLTFAQFYDTILELVPIDKVISSLARKRLAEFEGYLMNTIGNSSEGEQLIMALINGASEFLENQDSALFEDAFSTIISYIEDDTLSAEHYKMVLSRWLGELRTTPGDIEQNISILKKALTILFQTVEDNREVMKDFQNLYAELLGKYANENMTEWVEKHLQFVPYDVLERHLEERLSLSNKTVFQTFVPPKNASFMATSTHGTVFFYDLPASQYIIKYQDVRLENVGHPRLLFAIYTNSKGVQQVKLAALKGKEPLTANTPLYRYPFSNVFPDGRICWSDYGDLEIDSIPTFFLSTPNNSHLSSNCYQTYQSLVNKDYDEKELLSMKLSLEDWF